MVVGVLKGSEQTVAAAGTAVALSSTDLYVTSLSIIAKTGNTDVVYIGDSAVVSTDNAGLAPGTPMAIPAGMDAFFNLADIFIDAAVNGEGIDFWYRIA